MASTCATASWRTSAASSPWCCTNRSSMLEDCAEVLAIENGRVVADLTRTPAPAMPSAVQSGGNGHASNVMAHPAAQAWHELYPDTKPVQVAPLKVRRQKNRIYRIVLAGRPPVIAKRCGRPTALIERAVYETVLPRAGVPSLGFHGFLEEPDGEHCWIFIDEATGDHYSSLLPAHRAVAGRWLGLLHSSTSEVVNGQDLPDAGPHRYHEILQFTCEFIEQHLDNPVLTGDDLDQLRRVQDHLRQIETEWHRLEAVCDGVPKTLVHGDFNGKNLRLRLDNGHSSVVVFDWEDAGWGVPAVDLAQQTLTFGRVSANPDIAAYLSTMQGRCWDANAEVVQRLAYCGSVFRALASLRWAVPNLANDWAHDCARNLQIY